MLRNNNRSLGCGVIVLTEHRLFDLTRDFYRKYNVHHYIDKRGTDKQGFNSEEFLAIARRALLDGWHRRAAFKNRNRYYLTIEHDDSGLRRCYGSGPEWNAIGEAHKSSESDIEELASEADSLGLMIAGGNPISWRSRAADIGQELYGMITTDPGIFRRFVEARTLARRKQGDLVLRFRGPSRLLGVPFELMKDHDVHLCFRYMMSRQLVHRGSFETSKPERFHEFLKNLGEANEPLRVLLVEANHDGNIPATEEENSVLREFFEIELPRVGYDVEVQSISTSEATVARVTSELEEGIFHIFHYSGHGLHKMTLPEESGLVLQEDGVSRTLTAADLNQILADTPLRLAFLSCCLGAKNERDVGRGDFHGTLEAVARADVPMILGYRWEIEDRAALDVAVSFYRFLFYSLCPAEALLKSRRAVSRKVHGRDHEIWASPVLLMQVE